MDSIYLTPASIGYLNQVILAFLVTAFLTWRRFSHRGEKPQRAETWLLLFMGSVLILSLIFFLDASLLPSERQGMVYLGFPAVALLLVALLQFAYHYPHLEPGQQLECKIAWLASLGYLLIEIGVAVDNFLRLGNGEVTYRSGYLDYVPVVFFLLVISIFVRKALRHWEEPALRWFASLFVIPLTLAVLNVLRLMGAFPFIFT